jgi:hypothetical protein
MKLYMLVVILFSSISVFCQDTTKIHSNSEIIDSLTTINEQLELTVDSLNKKIEELEKQIERSKWDQIEDGMKIIDVLEIMGETDKVQTMDFGYKKLIFGTGYTGYVLVGKDSVVVDSSPPLYLRMDSELIKK